MSNFYYCSKNIEPLAKKPDINIFSWYYVAKQNN